MGRQVYSRWPQRVFAVALLFATSLCLGAQVEQPLPRDLSDVESPHPHIPPETHAPPSSNFPFVTGSPLLAASSSMLQSRAPYRDLSSEPFQWKGLLLQSFAFQSLENGVRIMTANQSDRHILLNKPFWADYLASLNQFNMGRWNDGDDFIVNYIGHPAQGAITGYLEIQNDPRGRALKLSRDRAYWHSRFRAFLWNTAFSTDSEIGPFGEAGIFNEGGTTGIIHCKVPAPSLAACKPADAIYTNNTGWVDFIITPVIGTLGLIGEDAVDRYITDPLVEKHPGSIKYQILRGTLNPPRTLANLLRGELPWYRDYDHPEVYESQVVKRFEDSLDAEPVESGEFGIFYSSLAVGASHVGCSDCRTSTDGLGAEAGLRVRPYLDVVASVENHPGASPVSSSRTGGSLAVATFGLRSGFSGQHFALKAALKPGFATWSQVLPEAAGRDRRTYSFAAAAEVSGDARLSKHLALRLTIQQLLIRYRSPINDPPGIGTPPDLSFPVA